LINKSVDAPSSRWLSPAGYGSQGAHNGGEPVEQGRIVFSLQVDFEVTSLSKVKSYSSSLKNDRF
jgi:hypothetical protein